MYSRERTRSHRYHKRGFKRETLHLPEFTPANAISCRCAQQITTHGHGHKTDRIIFCSSPPGSKCTFYELRRHGV